MNKEELCYGALAALIFLPLIGIKVLFMLPFTAVLWALGGMDQSKGGNKLYRRLGVPAVIAVTLVICLQNWHYYFGIPCGYGVLCIGYGIPSTQPPDDGSALGRFWMWAFGGNATLANIGTRWTIMTLLLVAMSWPAVLK